MLSTEAIENHSTESDDDWIDQIRGSLGDETSPSLGQRVSPQSRRDEEPRETMRLEKQIKRIEIIEVPEQFYFKVSAAAKYIGLSANTLRKYSDLGLIKAKRLHISGDRTYRKDQLDEFMENLPDAIDSFTASPYNHPQSDLSSNPRKEVMNGS